MLFTTLLVAVNAKNMLNYLDYDPKLSDKDRCTLLLDKRIVLSFDLDDDKTKLFQYDKKLGVIKMLINDQHSAILFAKEVDRTFFEGIYYRGYGNTGPIVGRCVL